MGSIDTFFNFPIVELDIAGVKGIQKTYTVNFNGVLLPLQIRPSKGQKTVEISARELLLCFSRH